MLSFALVSNLITFNITSGIEFFSGSFLIVPSMSTGTSTLPTPKDFLEILCRFLTSFVSVNITGSFFY